MAGKAEFIIPEPQPKQKEFFLARERFVLYGGARGGGKSWCVRNKAPLLALKYPGIRILLLRRSFPELRENHIRPLRAALKNIAAYKTADKTFEFPNGSVIILGYCATEGDVDQYQGQEYDVIFLEEATQFTEYQFLTLTACNRGANSFPKRMYLTANPGGVGHAWVKRLFIDRAYRAGERPEDYRFIPAKVTDNKILMESNPDYVRMLDNLPEGIRAAWRDGDWDVFIGQYFTEWDREIHVVEPFAPPTWWKYYITIDYGLDMLAVLLIGVDAQGEAWALGEVYEGRDLGEGHDGLIISEAAKAVKELAGGRRIAEYLAPPDLWHARQETGKSVADIFAEHGVDLTQTSNDRIAGWLAVKDWLKPRLCEDGEKRPRIRFFASCRNIIRTLPLLEYDAKQPSDVATEPHELTHAPDALRGFCIYWTSRALEPASAPQEKLIAKWEREEKAAKRRRRRR